MNIIPVGDNNNLYRVTDVFPQELIDYCQTCNWENLPYIASQGQKHWKRKLVLHTDIPQFSKLNELVKNLVFEIQSKLYVTFESPDTIGVSIWNDLSGFITEIHRDFNLTEYEKTGKYTIPVSMQVYLTNGPQNLGTVFYSDNKYTNKDAKLKYAFPYEANTGYLMFNDQDQWHEMMTPVPENFNRISCYILFSDYNKNS